MLVKFTAVTLIALLYALVVPALPVQDGDVATTTENSNDTGPLDLYVIKTIFYEVGILTDADNSTEDNSTEISHRVDLTFFNPNYNGTDIDLSNIQLPFQTNVSGVQVTGLAPVNLGSIPVPPPGETSVQSASDLGLNVPLIPNAIVTVSHNVSTTNPEKGAQVLSTLPDDVLGVKNPLTTSTPPSDY